MIEVYGPVAGEEDRGGGNVDRQAEVFVIVQVTSEPSWIGPLPFTVVESQTNNGIVKLADGLLVRAGVMILPAAGLTVLTTCLAVTSAAVVT